MRSKFFIVAALLALAGCSKVEDNSISRVMIYAGFRDDPETRSRIELNEEGSVVKVLWTQGDSFTALYTGADGVYKTTFTTYEDGVTDAAFWSNGSLAGTDFQCFYPDYNKWGNYEGETVFGINLPAEQTAVAGGIEEGLNRACAFAEKLSKDLREPVRFYNLPSLLKFRLEGAAVPEIKEVAFSSSGTLAGDMVFHWTGDILTELPGDLSFSGDVHASRVVLKGDFQEGVDYYIALWPRKLSGFQMEFKDGNGDTVIKRSDKTVTFERSRVKDFGTIRLGD